MAERVLAGDPAAASRALSIVTDEREGHESLSRELFARRGPAHTIGLCGPPGSGKSSVINRLVSVFRKAGETVGVLAVDPTSPFTGGAFLGDRLRVQEHALDSGVFMRSLATRGMLGGLNATIFGAVHVLQAYGCQRILIETVGTGQDEVDIADVADTVLCVSAPYQGDEFQAMKAGTMEIADVFVVNKADLADVDKAVAALRDALSLGHAPDLKWKTPILPVSATRNEGFGALGAAIDEHREHLRSSEEGKARAKRQLRKELSLWISRRLYQDAMERVTDADIDELLKGRSDPVSTGERLLKQR
ncbi:MAG TPA: methylmalonyl Co-A mutase-associated GTPase MeaB [Elusimicrobiota bacterium]|nr:methylmalonyl Co-A mutase-associated GTPase MeaB [Elusimicrobiota bacterium]